MQVLSIDDVGLFADPASGLILRDLHCGVSFTHQRPSLAARRFLVAGAWHHVAIAFACEGVPEGNVLSVRRDLAMCGADVRACSRMNAVIDSAVH